MKAAGVYVFAGGLESTMPMGRILPSSGCATPPTSAAPASLLAAEQQLGGEHLADVHAPIPPRGEVWAFGIFVVLVCVTVVMVYLIWSW